MARVIECEGAPRDLGLDQGRACRAAVRRMLGEERSGRWSGLPFGRRDSRASSLDREIRRHFPHLSERFDGLARGAGVRRAELMSALARAFGEIGAGGASPPPGAGLAARTASGPLLACAPAPGLAIRRSRPEVGYHSLELTPPWLVCAVSGVNEAGLAVASVKVSLPGRREAGAAAPALLLVQECLQRFASVDSALDWCRRRPARAGWTLLFAAADGEIARHASDGRVSGPRDAARELLVEAGDGTRREQIQKACRQAASLDAELLVQTLAGGLPGPCSPVALVDPVGRRLALAPDPFGPAAEAPAWLSV